LTYSRLEVEIYDSVEPSRSGEFKNEGDRLFVSQRGLGGVAAITVAETNTREMDASKSRADLTEHCHCLACGIT